jgi:O-antigen ligase
MNSSLIKQPINISYRNPEIAKIIEASFLAYLTYSLTAISLGINIPYLAGAWLSILAFLSFWNVDWKQTTKIPMYLILVITFTFIYIQILAHQMSLSMSYVWSFVMWVVLAWVIFILSGRQGFIKRLAIVMFIIGFYLRFFIVTRIDIVARQRLESGSGIDNSNDYAAWMGFSALVFWIWSWQSITKTRRILILVLFAMAVFFLLGTVSRGALLAMAVGMLVAFRNIPRRRWLLIVIILGVSYFILQGLSNSSISNYYARIHEESGRLSRWPTAIRSIQMNPWWGYGVDKVSHKGAGIDITPHNGILFIWLSSGFIPAIFFVVLWGIAISRAYKGNWLAQRDLDPLPLILFAFIEILTSNIYFMTIWATAALFYCFRTLPAEKLFKPSSKKEDFVR